MKMVDYWVLLLIQNEVGEREYGILVPETRAGAGLVLKPTGKKNCWHRNLMRCFGKCQEKPSLHDIMWTVHVGPVQMI